MPMLVNLTVPHRFCCPISFVFLLSTVHIVEFLLFHFQGRCLWFLPNHICWVTLVSFSFQWLYFSAWFLLIPFFFLILSFLFYIEVYPINNVMIVSGEQWRDSAMHIYVSILPQTLLPYRLLHNSEQSSLCCTIGPCWLPILNIAECVYSHLRLPDYPFPLATISSFYKSVSLFLIHSISQLTELCCSLIAFLTFFVSFSIFSFNFWVAYLKQLS